MQKYLMQHDLKAFTILLPRNFKVNNQSYNLLEKDFSIRAENVFVNHFAKFIITNDVENLPVFNFLSVFYNVKLVEETDAILKFNLVLNDSLNKTMWLRLKHTVFNQYNALIGFSDVLTEVEVLDDDDKLLIQRINKNAREMFKNTKLLMEFEQIKDFNFELKSRSVSPQEYVLSYLRHMPDIFESITLKYNSLDFENITLNIDNECFKTSLDLLFYSLKEIIDLSKINLELELKDYCILRLDYNSDTFNDNEFIYELQLINDFYQGGIDMKHLSSRMFYLIYTRLIVEKLGGEFTITIDKLSNYRLLVEWIFPFIEEKNISDSKLEADQSVDKNEKKTLAIENKIKYPLELRREIAHHFSVIDGVFVLDDWKAFANRLDILIVKYNPTEVKELKQIVENIYIAVKGFDITALQLIMNKIRQISKME
ncbi:MAG: hypothetical protein J7K39_00885 [Bacteroidales bacterium]|nr:hypothetical protein [Bacteroidales bacterium]